LDDGTLPIELDKPETINNNQNPPENTINNQNIINESEDQILGDIPTSPPKSPKIPGCPSENEDQTDHNSDNENPPILS
jgi:hypothetical protein